MPQLNVEISHELQAKLAWARDHFGLSIARFVRLSIERNLAALSQGLAQPAAPVAPGPVLDPEPAPDPAPVPCQEAQEEPRPTPVVPTPAPALDPVWEKGALYLPAHAVADALGIEIDDLLVQLDPEDTKTFGSETCIASFGIQVAVSIAKQQGLNTRAFEAAVESLEQEPPKGN